MVVIFGWGDGRSQDLGPVAPAICPNCHNDVYMHHVRSEKKFSLFFVPLASYGGNEYLACPTCQHALQVPPGQRQRVANMRAATASFRQGHVPKDYHQQTVHAFWGAIGVNPNGEQVLRPSTRAVSPAASSAPSGAATSSLAARLKQLGDLHKQGVLTEQEFAAAKKRLISG